MKKIIMILCLLSFALALSSCTSSKKDNTSLGENTTKPTTSDPKQTSGTVGDNESLSEEEAILSRVNGLSFNGFNGIFSSKNDNAKKRRYTDYNLNEYGEEFENHTESGFHKMTIISSDSDEYSSINPLNSLREIVDASSGKALAMLANAEKNYYRLPGQYVIETNEYGSCETEIRSTYYGYTDINTLTFIDTNHSMQETKDTDSERGTIVTSIDGHDVLKEYSHYLYTGLKENDMDILSCSNTYIEDGVSFYRYFAEIYMTDLIFSVRSIYQREDGVWCSLSAEIYIGSDRSDLTYDYIEKIGDEFHHYSGKDDIYAYKNSDTIINSLNDEKLSYLIENISKVEEEYMVTYDKAPFESVIESLSSYKEDFHKDLPEPIDGESYRKMYEEMPRAKVSFVIDNGGMGYTSVPFKAYECKNADYYGKYTSRSIYETDMGYYEGYEPKVMVGFYIVIDTPKQGYLSTSVESITVGDKTLEKNENVFYIKIDELMGGEEELVFVLHVVESVREQAAVSIRYPEGNEALIETYRTSILDPKDAKEYTGPYLGLEPLWEISNYVSYSYFHKWLTPLVDNHGSSDDSFVPVGDYLMVYADPYGSITMETDVYANEEKMTPHPYFKGLYYYQVNSTDPVVVSIQTRNIEGDMATVTSQDLAGMVVDDLGQLGVTSGLGNTKIQVGKYVVMINTVYNRPLYCYLLNGEIIYDTITIYDVTYYYFKIENDGEYNLSRINKPWGEGEWSYVDSRSLGDSEYKVKYTPDESYIRRRNDGYDLEESYLAKVDGYLVVVCDSAKERGGILYNGVPMEEKTDRDGLIYYIAKVTSTDVIVLSFANKE